MDMIARIRRLRRRKKKSEREISRIAVQPVKGGHVGADLSRL